MKSITLFCILLLSTHFLSLRAVKLNLVYSACIKYPKLPFCDAHLLGLPSTTTETTSTKLEVSELIGNVGQMGNNREQKEFLTWLTEFNDQAPIDDDDDIASGEGLNRKSSVNTEAYCAKYKNNFHSYCSGDRGEELEDVLANFCRSYKGKCGDFGSTGTSGIEDDFPQPKSLEKNLQPETTTKTPKTMTEVEVIVKEDKRTFTGLSSEYCMKFLSTNEELCLTKTAPVGQTKEFCESFKDNCNSDGTSKKKGSEIEDEDLDDFPSEDAKTNQVEGESADVKPAVQEYCEKYSENFNYYCAGEDSTGANTEKFCASYRKNCPEKVGSTNSVELRRVRRQTNPRSFSLKESGSFLGGRGRTSDGHGDSIYIYRGTKKEYCDKFSVNYEYYCRGDSDDPEITSKFCPSYKQSCPEKFASPPSPFTKKAGTEEETEEVVEHRKVSRRRGGRRKKLRRKRKPHPCTPDCNQRIHKHCTADCKCDYAYPHVQKFCNPPPLPLFLNTCRLWYNGCPKYERYHYASQFVYSKAEKGKVIEGPANQKPFSVVSPTGERLPVNLRQTGVGNYNNWARARDAAGDLRTHDEPLDSPNRQPNGQSLLSLWADEAKEEFEKEQNSRSDGKRRKRSHYDLNDLSLWQTEQKRTLDADAFDFQKKSNDNESLVVPPDLPSPSRLNDGPPPDPFKTSIHRLPAVSNLPPEVLGIIPNVPIIGSRPKTKFSSLEENLKKRERDSPVSKTESVPSVPKDQKSKDTPIVPSDSVFQNALSQYGAFTDNRGVLHRPRSRSPFTKPGLWEPNPDNPHNRDHANKFYYHPQSVNVDWLGGQIAWGAHWAVPAAGVGGTDGFSAIHFPTVGTFFNIPDDYD